MSLRAEDVHRAAERPRRGTARRRARGGSATTRSAARDVVLGERVVDRSATRSPTASRHAVADARRAPALVPGRAGRERVREPRPALPERQVRAADAAALDPDEHLAAAPARAPARRTTRDAAAARDHAPRASSRRGDGRRSTAVPRARPARRRSQPCSALDAVARRRPSGASPVARAEARRVGDVVALVAGPPAVEATRRRARRAARSISVEQLEQADRVRPGRRRC